jgi:hypothetical protein
MTSSILRSRVTAKQPKLHTFSPSRAKLVCAAAVLGAALSGCHVPDEDNIEVSVQVDDVQMALSTAVFGRQLAGTFTLTAILGELAQQPSTVQWQKFALTRPDSNEELLALSIAADVPQTLDVPKGTTQHLAIRLEPAVVEASAAAALCAGPVRISGVTVDSATSHTKPAYSPPFTLPGCEGL